MPQKTLPYYMALSGGHGLLKLLKFILKRVEVMSGVRMLHFLRDWWKFIQIQQYYTMALK